MARTRRPPSHRQNHAAHSGPSPVQWLYGRHPVAAALANPARHCQRLVGLPETAAELAALLRTARAGLPAGGAETLDRRALEQLLPAGAVHQGMALAAEPLPAPSLEALLAALPSAGPQTLVLLDQVTDPHNVGAILRSAAAFGAGAVVLPEHGAPAMTGALAKAASGALELLPLLRVANLSRAIARLKQEGFWSVGLEEGAAQELGALDLPPRVALVLGAEGSGLRRLTRDNCDLLARLPTRHRLASLNVSNAAAVALYILGRRAPAV